MKSYTAYITDTNNFGEVTKQIKGRAQYPQDFHKEVLFSKQVKYPKDEILKIINAKGVEVFNIKRGFSGS